MLLLKYGEGLYVNSDTIDLEQCMVLFKIMFTLLV